MRVTVVFSCEIQWIQERFANLREVASLGGSTSAEHLLDEVAVEELSVLVRNGSGLLPFSLRELVSHGSQGLVELVGINFASSTSVKDREGAGDGGLIVGLSNVHHSRITTAASSAR